MYYNCSMSIEDRDKIKYNDIKTHFETIIAFPIFISFRLARNPKGVLKELLAKGPRPSYRALYKGMYESSH